VRWGDFLDGFDHDSYSSDEQRQTHPHYNRPAKQIKVQTIDTCLTIASATWPKINRRKRNRPAQKSVPSDCGADLGTARNTNESGARSAPPPMV
jgi:hypothetical protein